MVAEPAGQGVTRFPDDAGLCGGREICAHGGNHRPRGRGVRPVLRPVLCRGGPVACRAAGDVPGLSVCLHGARAVNLVKCASSMRAPSKSTASPASKPARPNDVTSGLWPELRQIQVSSSGHSLDATRFARICRSLPDNPRKRCGSSFERPMIFFNGCHNFFRGRENSLEACGNSFRACESYFGGRKNYFRGCKNSFRLQNNPGNGRNKSFKGRNISFNRQNKPSTP